MPLLIAFRLSSMGFGGAERVFLSVADALWRAHDVEIHFIVDRLGRGETEETARQSGYKLFGLNSSRTLRTILPLKRYLDTHRPDVLISAYTDTNMAALISAKLARHKCVTVVSEHASLDEHWRNAPWKRRLVLNAYVALGYRLADHVLAVSRGIVSQIEQRLKRPERISCIYNPVRFNAAERSHAKAEPRVATILAVGRIARQKDYLTLLRAFRIVLSKMDARLVIVGGVHELDEKRALDEFVAANALGAKVEFVGYTAHVERYYPQADLFVLSSAWEGFGNVLIEAMAFGLPVVSTDCRHGPAEILGGGQYGTLVPVGNAPALAEAIVHTLAAPPPDGDALRKRSQEFSEERIGAQYKHLIDQLLAAA